MKQVFRRNLVELFGAVGLTYIPALLVTLVGYYRVITSWWFHDDWVFLANVAGIASRETEWVRFVSYKVYWTAMYAAWGLDPIPYAVSRLVVHFLCAAIVIKLAGRLGLSRIARSLAGAVFAASPVAFESLFWGTGITEQFGALFGLASVYFLFSAFRRRFVFSFFFIVLTLFSKETGWFLPFLWGALALRHKRFDLRTVVPLAALVFCLVASVWATRIDLAASGEYPLSLTEIPRNFFVYGFWLVAPVQLMRGLELGSNTIVFLGMVVWATWSWFAIGAYKRGSVIPLLLLSFTVLPLLPATLIGDHAVPRYLYCSLPGLSLGLGWLARGLVVNRGWQAVPLVVLLALYAQTSTAYRLDARWPNGTPIHRLVAKETLSRHVFQAFREADLQGVHKVVFLDPEPGSFISVDLLKASVGQELGVRLVQGNDFAVSFRPSVQAADRGAIIIRIGNTGQVSYGKF